METLAAIFVSVITAVHSVAPQANIPQVLGVEVSRSDSEAIAYATPESSPIREKRNETLEKARERRKEIESKLQQKRQETIQKIEDRRELLMEKIARIKDEQKRKVVENIAQRLPALNEKWVSHWNSVLTRLTEIVAKIESRSAKLASNGRDTTALANVISAAKTAINNAQTAVSAQAAKVYTLSPTSDETLGSEVRKTTEQFKSDIKSVLTSIQSAREAVQKALEALKALGEISNENKQ